VLWSHNQTDGSLYHRLNCLRLSDCLSSVCRVPQRTFKCITTL